MGSDRPKHIPGSCAGRPCASASTDGPLCAAPPSRRMHPPAPPLPHSPNPHPPAKQQPPHVPPCSRGMAGRCCGGGGGGRCCSGGGGGGSCAADPSHPAPGGGGGGGLPPGSRGIGTPAGAPSEKRERSRRASRGRSSPTRRRPVFDGRSSQPPGRPAAGRIGSRGMFIGGRAVAGTPEASGGRAA